MVGIERVRYLFLALRETQYLIYAFTVQLVSLSMLMLDEYYRTLKCARAFL